MSIDWMMMSRHNAFTLPEGQFYLTVGTSGNTVGYEPGVCGSISNQPFPGLTLAGCYDNTSNSTFRCDFEGDVTATITSSYRVYVDGVIADQTDDRFWYVGPTPDETRYRTSGNTTFTAAQGFVDSTVYLIDIKIP